MGAAGTSTLVVALQPPLGVWDPRYQISFLALGSRSVFRALARQGEHPSVKNPVAARSAFFPSGFFFHVSGPRFSPSRYRPFPALRTAPLLQSRFSLSADLTH